MASRNAIGGIVSARLRRAGFNISPSENRYKRDGVYVSARDRRVSVLISTGNGARDYNAAVDVISIVSEWPQVTDVVTEGNDYRMFVWFTYTPMDASACRTGSLHPRVKLSDADVEAIREAYAATAHLGKFDPARNSYASLAKRYGVAGPTIANIVNRKRRA